ncbi:hypothetical protein F2Q70_00009813 [Brassica cretica]|uniref:Uncharacterized protein n=1 Tax=Brassica cretica TaxID=69181 RepID=A0A8S9LXM0_BRACR|nr:hypothetical protein F2Q70_00009813 [Brassica cretica]
MGRQGEFEWCRSGGREGGGGSPAENDGGFAAEAVVGSFQALDIGKRARESLTFLTWECFLYMKLRYSVLQV